MKRMIRAFVRFGFASLVAPLVLAAGSNPVVSDTNLNTAMGTGALSSAFNNSSGGQFNVAAGYQTLLNNTNGSYNSAFGYQSLLQNTSGGYNSAFGAFSLINNTTGSNNTAVGAYAEMENSSGYENVAVGYNSLSTNTTGVYNTAAGLSALEPATGSYNIAIGAEAGSYTGSGNYNIEIGATGGPTDSNVIRIGTAGQQNAAYIQGAYGVEVGSSSNVVVIDNIGHLGTYGSAERFKTDVKSMPPDEHRIERLRPVTFRLKNDPTGPLHYGLIAEEVAKVDPNLVFRSQRDRIDGVHYEELTPILLKEVQRQRSESTADDSRLSNLESQLTQLRTALEESRKGHRAMAEQPREPR